MTFLGNSDDANHPGCFIICATPYIRFSAKNMTGPETLKRSKLKAISHGFRHPWDPCIECNGMSRGDMGLYIKDFYDFEPT